MVMRCHNSLGDGVECYTAYYNEGLGCPDKAGTRVSYGLHATALQAHFTPLSPTSRPRFQPSRRVCFAGSADKFRNACPGIQNHGTDEIAHTHTEPTFYRSDNAYSHATA